MNSPDFVYPLDNPVFLPTVVGITALFVVSFVLLLIHARGDVAKLFSQNIGKRYLGWLFITPFYFVAIFYGRIPGLLVLTLLILLTLREVVTIARLSKLFVWVLSFLALVSVYVTTYQQTFFYSLPLLYFSVVSYMALRLNDTKKSLWHALVGLFASIWIIYGLCHLILLSKLNNTLDSHRVLMVLVLFAVCLADIGSYVFGKLFHKLHILDKYKIASNISPNKTYIGMLGQIIGAYIAIFIFYPVIKQYLPLMHWLVIGILIGLFSASGGMINSMFKRYFDVKDSGKIIPGHGGLLDRIDSLIRVVIIVYYYLVFTLH